jgi:hypothetical protein
MKTSVPSYNLSVFINCPFDRRYLPIFHALIFAIHDAGFYSRCALEVMGTEVNRLHRIIEIIGQCRYGIHDLSRVEVTRTKLPRFNMPFEAGLFFGCRAYGSIKNQAKRILVLDSEPYRYMKVLSDIAGQDAQWHHNDPLKAIEKVRNWLSTSSRLPFVPGGRAIGKRYEQFLRDLPGMLRAARVSVREINQLEFYNDYRLFVIAWLKRHPL